jgi:hypothetical protein
VCITLMAWYDRDGKTLGLQAYTRLLFGWHSSSVMGKTRVKLTQK